MVVEKGFGLAGCNGVQGCIEVVYVCGCWCGFSLVNYTNFHYTSTTLHYATLHSTGMVVVGVLVVVVVA